MIQKSCRSLLSARINIEILDQNGVVELREQIPFRSFSRSGWRYIPVAGLVGNYAGFDLPLYINGTTDIGFVRRFWTTGGTVRIEGIWIGEGDTSNIGTVNDLVSAHDMGDWSFSATTRTEVDYRTLKYERSFTNDSGGDLDVNEICMYASSSASSTQNLIMLCRDILPATRTLSDGKTLRVEYTFDFGEDATSNFYKAVWWRHLDNGTSISMNNLAGSSVSQSLQTDNLRQMTGQSGNFRRGIVIGDSETANDPGTLWAMPSQHTTDVTHGDGLVEVIGESDLGALVKMSRTFLNDTGAPIVVKDIGIYMQAGSSTTNVYLCWRRVLEEPDWITIPDQEAETIALIMELDYVPVV